MKSLALALLLVSGEPLREAPKLGQLTLGVQEVLAGDVVPATGCWMSETACTRIAQKVRDCAPGSSLPAAPAPSPSSTFPVLMLLAGFVGGVVLTGWALHDKR